jgi:hypothetical protein
MPIVDITPVGSRSYDPQKKVVPVYLVLTESPLGVSKVQQFLAVKLDELPYSVKIVGFETKENTNKIITNYQEIINSTDKGLYKEVQLPWQRIISIQNLIYKQK